MSTPDETLTARQQHELNVFEAAFDGRPVDAEFSELADLAVGLRQSRPRIDEEFAAGLDRRVDDHFPAEWTTRATDRRTFIDRLKASLADRPRRTLLPVTAGLATALVLGTVIASGVSLDGDGQSNSTSSTSANSSTASDAGAGLALKVAPAATATKAGGSNAEKASGSPGRYAAGAKNRRLARTTEVTLGTTPDGVQTVSNNITSVVDGHDGIMLGSNVEDGPEGVAGASFRLLFPTRQLESAVAELSSLADLRSRSQQATDITAPTLTVRDKLKTARAKAASLVNELAGTTTDEDRAKVESQLSDQRKQIARLHNRSNRLSRRANLTPVSVFVRTGEGFSNGSGGSWGPVDALHDIGKHLGTAAGVALIMLAIALPLALLALMIALINRVWVGAARRRAIESD